MIAQTTPPDACRYTPDRRDTHAILRSAYSAWRAGAGLRAEDVARLGVKAGLALTANRIRELGRDSDRGRSISAYELYQLLSAWADERRAAMTIEPPIGGVGR